MREQLLYLREEHGDVFATKLPTGQIIPWHPLSIGEFIRYQDTFTIGSHPPAYLENEIFKKCVLDLALVNNIDNIKAGIVSTVVATILVYSGPQSVDDLNQVLEFSRTNAVKIVHDLASFICQAFPAYKPEDIYDMDYTTLMLRTAMAEKKMLQTGFISEPLNLEQSGVTANKQVQEQQKREQKREESSKLLDKYYEQQGIKVPDSVKKARQDMREKIIDHPKPPPLSIASEKRTIITKADVMEHQAVLTGHEKDIVSQVKSTDDTAQVYDGYIKDLREGKELRILTDEERLAAAHERMDRNRLANLERQKKAMEAAKEELPELLKVREEARKRKARKAARRRR